MTVRQAIARYSRKEAPKKEEEEEEIPDELGILAVPGMVGEAVVEGAMEGIAMAIELAVKTIIDLLEAGMPLSVTLVEEQGGFRVVVPGASELINTVNAAAANVPLLLPDGDLRLKATVNRVAGIEGGTLTAEIAATPDWSTLTLEMALEVSGIEGDGMPRTIRLVLTGTATRGLYDAEEYELDLLEPLLKALIKHLPDDFGKEMGISRQKLQTLSREGFRDLLKQGLQQQIGSGGR